MPVACRHVTKTRCPHCGKDLVRGNRDLYICAGCFEVWSSRLSASELKDCPIWIFGASLHVCPICQRSLQATKITGFNRVTLNPDWEVIDPGGSGETRWTISCEKGHSLADMVSRLRDSGDSSS